MKQTPDVGLQYMMELGIKPAKNADGILRQLRERVGNTRAEELAEAIFDRRDRSALGQKSAADNMNFYDLKNQDFESSITLSGAHDGDIFRKTCNWIDGHREAFGQTILDVGCDCGIISCFLAKSFPQSHITSIDLSKNAIAVARELAERLGIHNVTFLHSSIEALPPEEYDTVFSSRTVNENHDQLEGTTQFLLLTQQGKLCAQMFQQYAERLTSHVKPGGHLVTIERLERDRLFLGYCLALSDCHMNLCSESYQELFCRESGRDSRLQALYATKEGVCQQAEQTADFFYGTFQDQITWLPQHLDVEAELILELSAKELIRGVYLHNQQGARVGKLALYTSKYEEDALFYYQGFLGEPVRLSRYDLARRDELIQFLSQELDTFAAGQITARAFQFLDGQEQPEPF